MHILRSMAILRAARIERRHLTVAAFEDALVLGVCLRSFLAVAARKAGVDFVVKGATDSFANALERTCQ